MFTQTNDILKKKGMIEINTKSFYKVGIYIRVSTREQAETGFSIGEQEARLKKYCDAMNWKIYKIYIDPGFSGAKLDRPALTNLINDINKGLVDAVLVWKLDRLSRSQKDTLFLIEDTFLKNGVEFVSTLENFDTSSPFGKAMIGILSVFAQLEREQIKERMQLGLDARAKTGKWHGGGFDPFGYDYIEGELHINKPEAEIVKKIYSLYLDRAWSIHKIKTYLNKRYNTKYGSFSHDSTITNILTNPIYISKLRWKNELYEAPHESIISEETFNKVQERRKQITWAPKDGKRKNPFEPAYLLTGLLYCENCGAKYYVKGNYSGHGDKKKYFPYYTCHSRGKGYKKYIVDPTCKNPSISTSKLDNILIEQIRSLSLDPFEVIKMLEAKTNSNASNYHEQQEELKKVIKTQKQQIKRLIELCSIGGGLPVQEIASQIETIQKNLDKNLLALETLKDEEIDNSINIDEVKDQFLNASSIIDSGDYDKIRALIQSLILKAVITKEGDLKIFWNFEKL